MWLWPYGVLVNWMSPLVSAVSGPPAGSRRTRCRQEIVAWTAVGQRADLDRAQVTEGHALDRLVVEIVGPEVDSEDPVFGRQRDAVEGRQLEARVDRSGRRGEQRRRVGRQIGVDECRECWSP